MMLGGTLFTYVMISRINSDYMNEIQRAVNYRPIDYNQHITDTDPDFVMMTYNIDKMYSCTDNPDIGYYGTNEWRLTIGGGSHIMYSTDFVRANAVMDSETGDGVYVRLVPSNDGTGDAIVYFSNSEGDTEYWGVSTSSDAEEESISPTGFITRQTIRRMLISQYATGSPENMFLPIKATICQ